MNPAYAQACFEVEGDLPTSFVVITAYNPRGLNAPQSRNEHQDATLRAVLQQKGCLPIRVIGRNQENTHREPGWGIELDLKTAKEIGTLFKQDAIFQIHEGQLTLHACQGSYQESLGSWIEKVVPT